MTCPVCGRKGITDDGCPDCVAAAHEGVARARRAMASTRPGLRLVPPAEPDGQELTAHGDS